MGPGPVGAPAGGGSGAAAGGPRGGIAIDFRRGRTSKERLTIDWTYPVWKPAQQAQDAASSGGTTVAREMEHALPLAAALELVVAGDRRPLLVMRECERCKGTDHALLSRSLDNEQTVLLTHWFHCVKLPPNVLEAKHPLTQMFLRTKDGERLPHLYFCDPDGGNKLPMPGDQSQADLWATMFMFLERNYVGDAKQSVKDMRSILSQFDKLDGMEDEIHARIDHEIEKRGLESDKLPKFKQELVKLAKERQQLIVRERALRELAMKDLLTGKPEADSKPKAKGANAGADKSPVLR
ncbi:MAG: hypothetical protein NT107_03970 [Planctomycetota bacterium]|nr:hypothetical protein [Planctomycetota bacterium]